MNNLPLDIINYIWSFDDTKYNNYDICLYELNKVFLEFNHKMKLANKFYFNKYSWFKTEYSNNSHKFYLKKIRQNNKFNYLIDF